MTNTGGWMMLCAGLVIMAASVWAAFKSKPGK